MRNLLLIAKEDYVNLIKNPMWIFYATAFPVLLVLILGFLTADNYGSQYSSYDYYGITLIIYGIITSGMTSANAFMEERIKKPNMRIIYAPGNVRFIYLSKIIAGFVFSFTFHLLDILFLYLVCHIHISAIPQVIVLFAFTELLSVTLGVMLCCIFKTEEMSNQILSIIINLMAIMGGLMFSMDGYGKVVRHISELSPAKWLTTAIFQMIYDQDYHLFLPTAGALLGVIVFMLVVCHITFRKEDCVC